MEIQTWLQRLVTLGMIFVSRKIHRKEDSAEEGGVGTAGQRFKPSVPGTRQISFSISFFPSFHDLRHPKGSLFDTEMQKIHQKVLRYNNT